MGLTDLYNEVFQDEIEKTAEAAVVAEVATEEQALAEEADVMIKTAEEYVEAGRRMARRDFAAMTKNQ